MKTAKRNSWKAYLKERLKDRGFKEGFEREKRILDLGISLAKNRANRGLTQAAVAKRIGTSTPQVSRTEKAPENANVKTLMRYADAIGMELKVKLVPVKTKKHSTRHAGKNQSSSYKLAAMRRA